MLALCGSSCASSAPRSYPRAGRRGRQAAPAAAAGRLHERAQALGGGQRVLRREDLRRVHHLPRRPLRHVPAGWLDQVSLKTRIGVLQREELSIQSLASLKDPLRTGARSKAQRPHASSKPSIFTLALCSSSFATTASRGYFRTGAPWPPRAPGCGSPCEFYQANFC